MSRGRFTAHRRVLTGRSCMFCATASTQRYRVDQLMPLHNHCDCAVAPIIGDADPGQIINHDLLGSLKKAGGSKYWKQRGLVDIDQDGNFLVAGPGGTSRVLQVAERQHGELGPVLVDRHDDFTSPADIAA